MDSLSVSPPLGLRDRQKHERERRIVKAAERLFARKGYAEVAMEDVAARAGLAVGTIYNYFPSKSALLLAIVRRETESLLARGQKILDDPPRDPLRAAHARSPRFLRTLRVTTGGCGANCSGRQSPNRPRSGVACLKPTRSS